MSAASDYLRTLFDFYGLGELTSWAMEQLALGRSEVEILQSMREQPVVRQRFAAVFEREELGLPAISFKDVVDYELAVAGELARAGLPPGFYDEPEDFRALLVNDKSVAEIQALLQQGFLKVQLAPPEVRDVFDEWFGTASDTALAMWFLDPDRATPFLLEEASAAELGGVGRMQGINVARREGELMAALNIDPQQARQGFTQVQQQAGLFRETVTEREDLTAETEGVRAMFGLDAESAQRLRRRSQQREAQFSGIEGAVTGQEGVVGLGTAGGR
jgi:hypothetical protein